MAYRLVKVRLFSVISVLIGMTATALAQSDDREATIRLLASQDAALAQVGERLSVASRSLCPSPGWAAGLVLQTRSQYGGAYREVAARVLGIGTLPTVTHVLPTGAAQRAGLAAGDQIVAIDGTRLAPTRPDDSPSVQETERALDALDRGLNDGEADLVVLRNGNTTSIRLAATPACRVRFEVRAGSDTNASATGERVQVASDLVDPAHADRDLAPLVAHELAHVILRHPDTLADHYKGLLPGFRRAGKVLRDSEIAADRLSVYLLAWAGYRPSDAATFQAEFGRRNGKGILSDRTHPDWRRRVAAIRVELARIAAQQATGDPIRPPADLFVTPSR